MVATPVRATIADLDAIPDDGRRYELIDGEIIVAAAPTWQHQLASRAIFRLLDAWVQQHASGEVMYAPFDIVLDTEIVVEPDIFFLSTAHLINLREGRYYGTPDLAVEVVSPTSQGYDAVTKMFRYAQAGIPEYRLVDPIARTFLILTLGEGNIYVPQDSGAEGRLASVVLPGLAVDPTTIFGPPTGSQD